MPDKQSILEAWIMVEHLSEGDINKSDKDLSNFDDLKSDDYYSLLKEKIAKRRFRNNQKGGVILFFDLFDFNDVIEYLRKEYNLETPVEEVKCGSKFSLALYFDKDLILLQDLTFLTVSGYIRNFKKVPKADEFRLYESELKDKLGQYFGADDEGNSMAPPAKFNEAVKKVFSIFGDEIDIESCRFQLVNSIETDSTNLHSFFIDDLEKAKAIPAENLNRYLLGTTGVRTNLDSKSDSAHFNPAALFDILQPRNYPLGRFPSNTKYALSFMQQVAVNLSVGYDNSQMRSVNGPPGTGKTTLLKDIFADLVVRQAYDICNLKEKSIQGTSKTRYFENASIGIIPDHITENSIVVASSNNGAVQNIVNELPLISGIDEKLFRELRAANYFRNISNSDLSMEWKDGKPEVIMTPKEEKLFWGLFSLEGGKADNVTGIISAVRKIVEFFDNEYEEDDSIYDEFLRQYEKVESLRGFAQDFADSFAKVLEDKKNYEKMLASLPEKKAERVHRFNEAAGQIEKKIRDYKDQISKANAELDDIKKKAEENTTFKDNLLKYIELVNTNKPRFWARRSIKKKHDCDLSEAKTNLLKTIEYEHDYNGQLEAIRIKIKGINDCISEEKANLEAEQDKLEEWVKKKDQELQKMHDKVLENEARISNSNFHPLNFDVSYEELQLSNPWFDEEYRIAQSKLFITALKVRKQFLYENRKNLSAACIIWNKQKSYLDNRLVIETAWGWINMAIPVISSTFASFGRMCKNIRMKTLGHLFIDEAGQALPQAAVGAIYRSRHVMVVGDPAQIKPVLTLDPNVLGLLGRHFDVSEKYLSESASTQTLVDAVSPYGYYRDKDMDYSSWIGIPLWVHRRCQYPMFTISNKISYGNLMVQGAPGYGKTGWFDVRGKAVNKYVKEQGEFLLQKIKEMAEVNPKILDKNEKDLVYVISPFSNVAFQLSRKLKEIGFTRFDDSGKPTNVGTIHTFQGKEAPIVFMVLGADKQSSGAARWAVSEPNMMNVAATRAKKEFYIIGDKDLYLKRVKCDVITDTNKIIEKYKTEHPELVMELEEAEVVEEPGDGVKRSFCV